VSAPVFLAEPGSLADVVDGAGVRLVGTVEAAGADNVRGLVAERLEEPAPDVALVLVQALAKGDRDELAIVAATKVGVDAVSRARWQGTVRAATKQSRRARMPVVESASTGARSRL